MALRRHTSPAVLEPALAGGLPRLRDLLGKRAASWRTEATARRALGAAVAAALGVAVLAAAAPSPFVPPSKEGFPLWMVGPLRGLGSWLPAGGAFVSVAFTVLIVVMALAYAAALACARHVTPRQAAVAVVALHAIFLVGPPLTLTDAFNYLDYARLGVLHGVNPYVDPPSVVPVDRAYGFATWHGLLSPYGPLFTLGTYPLALLGLPAGFWALKLATAGASLACLWLTWRIARRLGRPPVAAVLLVGLNPLVLVYGLGGVHNDFFMVALILAGIGAVVAGRPAGAGAALVAAAGIKMSAGLVAPFALLGSERRREMLAGAVAAGAALAAVSLAAFGPHVPGLDTQSSLVTPLSPPNLVGLLLGEGGATAALLVAVRLAALTAIAWLAVRTARGADWLTCAGWATLALVVSLPWTMPWYALWLLPLAALSASPRLRRAALALTVFLLLTLTPISGFLLGAVCECSPADTQTGKRNAAEIRRFLH